MSAKYYVGTSSWAHKEWGPTFFPKDLPQRRYLEYLATVFNSVEVNATFYRNQSKETFAKWASETPRDFRFAIKVSRYLTHIKRMKSIRPYWQRFFEPTEALGTKRGPFLVQFPSFVKDSESFRERIDQFLTETKQDGRLKFAFEFRNESCFSDELLKIIKRHRQAIVFANSSKYPEAPDHAPAKFVYFRLHGPRKMFASQYKGDELKDWAKRMRKYYKQGKDVHVYFNNDMHAHAPKNARLLQDLLKFKR